MVQKLQMKRMESGKFHTIFLDILRTRQMWN